MHWDSQKRQEFQASSWVGPGKPNLQFELRWKAGGSARVTTGPKRPHRGVCPGPNIPLKGRQGSRVSIPDSPGGSGLAWRGSKDSAFLSSRDTDLLEPTEWTQGCRASSSVWREDSGLLSRPGKKEGPHLAMTGASHGFPQAAAPMGVFSRGTMRTSGSLSCGARQVRSPCAWRGGAGHHSRVMGNG